MAWSIVVELDEKTFVIEHRKLGLGIFAHSADNDELLAKKVSTLVSRGVRATEKYFDWLAATAITSSKLNLINRCEPLLSRMQYFLKLYRKTKGEAESRKEASLIEKAPDGTFVADRPSRFDFEKEADWLAISAIEAFFSWTEHLFVHLALLNGVIMTGSETADLAEAEWSKSSRRR